MYSCGPTVYADQHISDFTAADAIRVPPANG
jgi:cysteinyl-tRNA synthetase